MENKQIIKQIESFFERQSKKHELIYAIIFGSVLTDYFRKDSDIDIAVRFKHGYMPIDRLLDLGYELEQYIDYRVDIVDVLQASPSLRYMIFTKGKLIFCQDRSVYIEDKATSYSLYLDFKYVDELHFRRIINAIRGIKK